MAKGYYMIKILGILWGSVNRGAAVGRRPPNGGLRLTVDSISRSCKFDQALIQVPKLLQIPAEILTRTLGVSQNMLPAAGKLCL
jgi:hypothetical protein